MSLAESYKREINIWINAIPGALRAQAIDTDGALALSRYLARDFRNELRRAEEAIADALPALTPEDFTRMCNGDHAIRAEVERFRNSRWSFVDVTELRGCEFNDTPA